MHGRDSTALDLRYAVPRALQQPQRSPPRSSTHSFTPIPLKSPKLVAPDRCNGRRATRALDLFRTKLWWDHLPSPEVRGRGKHIETEEACPYCTQLGRMSTWHILAECQAPTLVIARRGAYHLLTAELRKFVGRNSGAAFTWAQAFSVQEDGSWRPPASWSRELGHKAGNTANHWYGCFPREWLDTWGEEGRAGDLVSHWEQGRSFLRGLSQAALRGCRTVWAEATALWGKAQQQRRKSDTAQGGDTPADVPDSHPELLGHHEIDSLSPLHRRMYEAATEQLMLLRTNLLGAKKLSPRNRRILY
jgi:hypothetical protein